MSGAGAVPRCHQAGLHGHHVPGHVLDAYRPRPSHAAHLLPACCAIDTLSLKPLRSLLHIHFTAAEIVASLDTACEDWDAGRLDHEAQHSTMVHIWQVAEASGVAAAAKRIIAVGRKLFRETEGRRPPSGGKCAARPQARAGGMRH